MPPARCGARSRCASGSTPPCAGSGLRTDEHVGQIAARRDEMHDALGADVAGGAVADAIAAGERRAAVGPLAVLVVAEAQLRAAVVVDLDHEIGGAGRAVEQRALRLPVLGVRLERARRAAICGSTSRMLQSSACTAGAERIEGRGRGAEPPLAVLMKRPAACVSGALLSCGR